MRDGLRQGGGFFFFQAEDGIRCLVRSRGLGDVYKRQVHLNRAGKADQEFQGIGVPGQYPFRPPAGGVFLTVSYTHLTLPTTYPV